jgi:hypothetical protein
MLPPHEQASELYRNWWKVVETSFRLLSPPVPPGLPFGLTQAQEELESVPESMQPIADALHLTRRLLTQYYGALIPSLSVAPGGQQWESWAVANAARLKTYLETSMATQKQLLESGVRAFSNMVQAWTGESAPLSFGGLWPSAETRMGNPYLEGLDRTFSALTDAFGMGPSRALRDAWRELIAADEQRRASQLEYFAVVGASWGQVIEGVAVRLNEMAVRGEQVDSILGWVRLWAGVAEKAVHEAMQSEAGLKGTSDYIRAALRYRQSRNRLVEIVSESLNVPTRAELDDAYLEIQQLKREMRELRRERRASLPKRRAVSRKAEEKSLEQND